jgi:Uma2 family endonuclease
MSNTSTPPAPPPSLAGRVVNDEPVSEEEYLRREREEAERRYEFLDGWLIDLTGASYPHNVIVSNLVRELGTRLRDSECRAVASDLRVAIPDTDRYVYPDVVVVCGRPDLEGDDLDTLRNPTAVVEVMSTSTEAYDRGEKADHYRSIPSLREYVLIDQYTRRVEHVVRQEDGTWNLRVAKEADAALSLTAVDAEVPLAEMYLDVFEG